MILDFGFWILDCATNHRCCASKDHRRQSGCDGTVNCTIANPKSKIQNPKFITLILITATLLLGCQTESVSTSDGWRMPPTPRPAPEPPASLVADRMFFTVGSRPEDTNNNGFPDSIKVMVALFSSQHPTSLRQEGVFVFSLYRQGVAGMPDAEPMVRWRQEPDAVKQAESQMGAGPCYVFNLSLLDRGTDRLPLEMADMVCVFEPSNGGPTVQCEGVRTIQIGRRTATN